MDWSFCIIYQAGQDLRAKWTDGRLYDATVLYMHQGKEAITCILPVGFIARIILVMWDEDFIGLANAFWSYFNLFVVVINIYQLMAFAFNLNDEGHATWPKPLQTNFCLSLCFFFVVVVFFMCPGFNLFNFMKQCLCYMQLDSNDSAISQTQFGVVSAVEVYNETQNHICQWQKWQCELAHAKGAQLHTNHILRFCGQKCEHVI